MFQSSASNVCVLKGLPPRKTLNLSPRLACLSSTMKPRLKSLNSFDVVNLAVPLSLLITSSEACRFGSPTTQAHTTIRITGLGHKCVVRKLPVLAQRSGGEGIPRGRQGRFFEAGNGVEECGDEGSGGEGHKHPENQRKEKKIKYN